MKASSFWRGFSWTTKSDNRYISCGVEEENSRGSTTFHHQYLVTWIWKILISQILIYSDVQMSRYFSKSCDPVVIMLLAPGEECHLDSCPKSCTYPSLVTIDPPEVKTFSILLYKNNCPMLFCTFTFDNSSFLTTVKKKNVLCILVFKKFWFKNSNYFPFWKGYTVCLAQFTFMILYLSHCDVTVWHRPDLRNPCNI